MPRSKKRENVALRCQECEHPADNYVTRVSKAEGKIKNFLHKKFCPQCRKHTAHKAKIIKPGY